MLHRRPRASLLQRIAAATVLVAFALLASLAASHLHFGADQDPSCSLCAAFGSGKLKTAPPGIAVARLTAPAFFRRARENESRLPHSTAVVLPPSCGPPRIA
jgi:hypothetical protein